MQASLVVTLVLHVLSGVFWAGSTFTLARTGGAGAEKLFRPQMRAALVAVLTGALLWHLLHRGSPGTTEYVLAAGALAAVVAAGIQGVWGRRAGHMGLAQRLAALLLGVTVICMAAARYA